MFSRPSRGTILQIGVGKEYRQSGNFKPGTKSFRKFNIMSNDVSGELLTAQGWPEIYPAYYFNFLEEELDRVCEALGTTRDNIVLVDANTTKYQIEIERKTVGRLGYKNLPYIHYMGHAYTAYRNFDWGYNIYETQVAGETIKYAEVAIESGEVDNLKTFLVIPKGKVFGLLRTGIRKFNAKFSNTPLPIIESDTLQLILDNTLNFLRHKRKIKELGFKTKRGILLTGPPGNGKTMLCKFIQSKCAMKNIEYTNINSSELQRLIHDQELNGILKRNTVVFFDDIDISLLNRKTNGDTVCSLLGALDGMNESHASIKIFTTNEKTDTIDPAFLRPGRIDLFVEIQLPRLSLRREYVNKFWPENLKKSLDIEKFCQQTNGLSFAEIEYIGSIAVNHYIFNGVWDIESALVEFKKTRDLEGDKRKFGF